MAIPMILAMTANEIRQSAPLPPNPAYFGCHFTDHDTWLLPAELPPGCGLLLDDRKPIPDIDHSALTAGIEALNPSFLIFDLQRPANEGAQGLIKSLTGLRCPIAMPPQYAKDHRSAVFLPPIPAHIPIEEYFRPWHHREIWLELALDATMITVTTAGSEITALTHATAQPSPHTDSMLHCHYKITTEPNAICFYCYRTREDIQELLRSPLPSNVTHAVAMFQELG